MDSGIVTWTTPDDLKKELECRWLRGDLLAAYVTGEALFPLTLRLKRPAARDVAERFGAVMDWADALRAASRAQRGYGYDLRWEPVHNRVQGRNELPVEAVIPSEDDALRWIRRKADAMRAKALIDITLERQPRLRDWLARRPLTVLEHADDWERILAVLDWFAAHPRPGIYLRQLDIPGIDTKFIEARRGLLSELLDEILPPEAIDSTATGVRHFAQRYGLQAEPPQVRFRVLDPALSIQGLTDLAIPPDQFASLRLPVRRVFITENRTNGLAFPDQPGSLVVFGLGYGLERLSETPWLRDVDVWYWGDIDTHGFGILNRLRASLPGVRSFLMDRETLEAHRELWGEEPLDKRYQGEPTLLTLEERTLFDDLLHDRLGERVRLEQERIRFGWLRRALEKIT